MMTIGQTLLIGAAAMAFLSFYVHTFIGGRYAARPLLAARELPKATIWLNYFTWHISTGLLLILAGTFGLGAAKLVTADAIMLATILAAMIALLSVAVTLKAGIPVWRFPASYLLGTTAVFSLFAITLGI